MLLSSLPHHSVPSVTTPGAQPVTGRIASIDGLRTIAVLGVIWIHVWTFAGNPAVRIPFGRHPGPDLERVVAIVGNGVNLFFVISGFCMYWMFARRELPTGFEQGFFLRMILNRWRRLAPAFYVAASLCAVGIAYFTGHFPWYDLLAHFAFLHLVLPHTGELASPFWSLTTEWQFYLFLPFFLVASRRFGFWLVFALSFIASLVFRACVYGERWLDPATVGAYLPMHLGEFCWGIAVAFLCARNVSVPRWLSGMQGFLTGMLVAYLGRILMVTEVVAGMGKLGPLCLVLAEPVLTLGCGIILWNVVGTTSVFSRGLSSRPMQFIGRRSYSIYLLHWWPCYALTLLVVRTVGRTCTAQLIAFATVITFLMPLGALSYHLFEASYFQRRRSETPGSVAASTV